MKRDITIGEVFAAVAIAGFVAAGALFSHTLVGLFIGLAVVAAVARPVEYVKRSFDFLAKDPSKYAMVVHAEANAIVNSREPLHGCSIYVHPFMPCSSCASLIIQAGIAEVITVRATGERAERWAKSFEVTEKMFSESGVLFNYLD